jgi:hypothetical protein
MNLNSSFVAPAGILAVTSYRCAPPLSQSGPRIRQECLVERVQKKICQREAVVHDPLGIVGAYSARRRVRARYSERVQANRRNLEFRKLTKQSRADNHE